MKNRDKSGGQVVDKPDRRRLREQIELGRRLMSLLTNGEDQAKLLAYVTKLEAKLKQAEVGPLSDEDEERR